MKKFILTLFALIATSVAFSQVAPPAIFYTDLTSAPNTGGQGSAGAFVTIHGRGFGATRGSSTVTIGGGSATSYPAWSDSAVTIQLGSSAKTGSIVVTVGGVASNSVPFTVRPGNIYFISSRGNDRNSGSYSSPWQSLANAATKMRAGDIVYMLDSGSTTSSGGGRHQRSAYRSSSNTVSSTALNLSSSGTAAAPIAIVAYPNASVSIGSTSGSGAGITVTGNNWVLAGLAISGPQSAVSTGTVSGLRLVASNLTCPNATSSGGCIAASGSPLAFLGNYIHDTGSASSTNQSSYQAMYLLDASQVEVGWNMFVRTLGCDALLAQSDASPLFSYLVHDNYFNNTRCDAIALESMNPAKGAVSVYNNIVQSAGTGPQPQGAAQDTGYAAIDIGGGAATPVEVFNNTVYDAGSFGGGSAGAVRATGAVHLVNNLFDLQSGEQYLSPDTNLSWLDGANNLFFGAGDMLGVFSNSVMSDPMLISPATYNFRPQAGSPAIDGGATVQLATDYDGVLRPQGAGYDIGAYEALAAQNSSPAAGTLSALPTSLSFGTVNVGESTTTTATLSNTSTTNVTISQIHSNNASFQVGGMTLPMTLGAGRSATMSVTFAPASAGTLSGTISVASDASDSNVNIPASGSAVTASPTVSLSPASLIFASQTVSTTSAAQTVQLSNSGSSALAISGIATSGDFGQTNNCGSSLAAGGSCTISITFAPTASGTRTGTLSVTDNAAGSPNSVSLSGTAVAPSPSVSLSPTSLTFASQTVGTTSAAKAVTLTNTGAGTLSISSIAATGDFAQSNTCGSSLAAGASCSISVRFTPTASGNRTGAVTLTDNAAASPQSVTLSGTGAAALTITTTSLPSGTVGSSYSTTLKAANGTTPYSWSNPACSGACNAGLTFTAAGVLSGTPVNAGSSTFSFVVTDSAGNTASKQLAITIAAPASPAVSLSSASLTFANQTVGTTSTAQSITLTNAGSGTLSISGIAATGDFAQSNTCGSSLAAGASCFISVTFTPTASGSRSGAVTLTDNAAASPQAVSLSGTGTAAAPVSHSVALNWTEASSSVSGYNVYRSTQSGTAYTKINSALVPTQAFTDTSVSGGQTYYYVVTAVGSGNSESAYSPQVAASVPAP